MQNAATRGVVAARKWEIFRMLYQNYGVPLPLIVEVTGVQSKTASRRAERENWRKLNTSAALQQKLAMIVDAGLDFLEAGNVAGADDELKTVHKVSTTLESLARSEEKMARARLNELKGRDRKTDTDDECSLDADGMRMLDRELQELIAKIESDRRAGAAA